MGQGRLKEKTKRKAAQMPPCGKSGESPRKKKTELKTEIEGKKIGIENFRWDGAQKQKLKV